MVYNPHMGQAQGKAIKGHPGEYVNKHAWSTSGLITVPITGRASGAFTLAADFVDNPGYYTAQFNIIPKKLAATGFVPRARAELLWSVEGNSIRREIEIIDGAAISGTGQGIKIKVTDNSISTAPPSASSYIVSVQVSPGLRPNWGGSTPPIRLADLDGNSALVTGNVFSLAPGSVIRNIPPDAGINAMYVQGYTADPTVIEFDEIGVFQKAFAHTDIARSNLMHISGRWMPLFPGTTAVQFNNDSGKTIEVSMLFGVEG